MLLIALGVSLLAPRSTLAATTIFTYQGQLGEDGDPANGRYEMTFRLLLTGTNTQVGAPLVRVLDVRNGFFDVFLDFGPGIFDGTDYDLEISVREEGSQDPPVRLAPPRRITPTPMAMHAMVASQVPDSGLSSNVPIIVNGGLGLPEPNGRLTFGPAGECSIGIDPNFSGLVERDPVGLRLLDPQNAGGRLLFGPEDDCTIEVDPAPGAPGGLLLRDPRGVRILPRDGLPLLLFGPTDDCSLGIDPRFPGLVERDPVGFRLLGRNEEGCRLLFGPTDDCTIEIDPDGPMGLLLRDPKGVRLITPDPSIPPVLRWGPTDECSIGLDPELGGLIERDPIGFRLLGRNDRGCRLLFGPTDDCTVEIDPLGLPGLLLRDPNGVRILDPLNDGAGLLRFGPSDDCTIGVDPQGLMGLVLRDPKGVRLVTPDPSIPPVLRWGPTDDCSIGLDPNVSGLVERDPTGFRLLGRNDQGCRLLFGPTDDCTVEIDPLGLTGLLLRDPNGVRIIDPSDEGAGLLRFGPSDECSIGIDPQGLSGLLASDPNGLRILDPGGKGGGVLRFGPTDECRIEVDPEGASGVQIRDPGGVRIINPDQRLPSQLIFGPTDECRISAGPSQAGGLPQMIFTDPNEFLFENGANFQGTVFANGFVPLSSRRFKRNIVQIQEPLKKIARLEGVTFDWVEEKGGKPALGFIAEEVGKVVPEVVAWETPNEVARGVNYDQLVALTVEGIKAQQEQIQHQQAQIATLTKEKGALEQRLAKLEALVSQLAVAREEAPKP